MEEIKNDLHCIITNHQSLKLIVVEIEDNQIDSDVYVVKHKHYPLHIDSYLWDGLTGIPRSKKLYIYDIHNFWSLMAC